MRVRKVLGTLVVISSTGSSSNGITAVGSTSPPSAFPDHDVCVGGRVVESWRKYDSGASHGRQLMLPSGGCGSRRRGDAWTLNTEVVSSGGGDSVGHLTGFRTSPVCRVAVGVRGGAVLSDCYNARMQIMITRSMRKVLIEELEYLPEEVEDMDPQIAAVVIEKSLPRPRAGMPIVWRKSIRRNEIPGGPLALLSGAIRGVANGVTAVLLLPFRAVGLAKDNGLTGLACLVALAAVAAAAVSTIDVENGAETPAGVVAQKIGTQVGVAGTFLQAKMGEGIRVVKEKSESARRGRWTPSNEVETLGADSSASNGAASSSHGENSKLRAMKALLSRIKKGAGSALGNWDAPESEDGSRKVPQYRKELLINEQFVKEIGSDGNFAKRLITKTLFKFGGKKWKKKLLTEKYLRKAAAIRKRRRDEDGIETHMDGDFTRHVSDDMPDDDYNDGRKGRRGKKGGNKKGQVEKATKIEKATNDFMGKERRIEAKGAVDDVQSGAIDLVRNNDDGQRRTDERPRWGGKPLAEHIPSEEEMEAWERDMELDEDTWLDRRINKAMESLFGEGESEEEVKADET